ncbi:hypothetical protein [Paraburkholderia sp.]|uniref:hypothetical protein n=1 Tax=Paraburkholderia sp. TaxID=1926495 RepID=UPI00257B41DA|nr:hypothetical protein [Paraburkholderia sp.]
MKMATTAAPYPGAAVAFPCRDDELIPTAKVPVAARFGIRFNFDFDVSEEVWIYL